MDASKMEEFFQREFDKPSNDTSSSTHTVITKKVTIVENDLHHSGGGDKHEEASPRGALSDEETNSYRRTLAAYQDGQQKQAQLIQKLQAKVSWDYAVYDGQWNFVILIVDEGNIQNDCLPRDIPTIEKITLQSTLSIVY